MVKIIKYHFQMVIQVSTWYASKFTNFFTYDFIFKVLGTDKFRNLYNQPLKENPAFSDDKIVFTNFNTCNYFNITKQKFSKIYSLQFLIIFCYILRLGTKFRPE